MGSDLGHTVASIIHSVKRAESHLKIIIIIRRRTLKRKQLFAFVELKLVLSLNQWIQPFIIIFWMHFPVRWCWCIQSYYSNKNHRKEAPWSEAEGLWPLSLWRECQSVLLLGQGHRLWWPWAEIKIKNRVKNWTTFILHPPPLQLNLTSTSSALGYSCEGPVCAPLLFHSWPAGKLLSFPSPASDKGTAENQTWSSTHPSFWREREAQRRWMWPHCHLRRTTATHVYIQVLQL